MVQSDLFRRLPTVYADNKYHNHGLYEWIEGNVDYRLHIVRRPEGAQGFARLPQRWVVERTFSLLGRSLRLHKDCEEFTITREAMIYMIVRRSA